MWCISSFIFLEFIVGTCRINFGICLEFNGTNIQYMTSTSLMHLPTQTVPDIRFPTKIFNFPGPGLDFGMSTLQHLHDAPYGINFPFQCRYYFGIIQMLSAKFHCLLEYSSLMRSGKVPVYTRQSWVILVCRVPNNNVTSISGFAKFYIFAQEFSMAYLIRIFSTLMVKTYWETVAMLFFLLSWRFLPTNGVLLVSPRAVSHFHFRE